MTHFRQGLSALLLIALSSGFALGEEPASKESNDAAIDSGTRLFEERILPVLVKHCYECHSKESETIEGGLELDSPTGMQRGGDSGSMFEAHHADRSELLRMLRHEDDVSAMPPDERLPDEVIAAFEEWINLGAPDSRQDSGPTAKEERLREAKKHWAFQAPQPVLPPAVNATDWSRDPRIDDFVLARLEAAGLKPAPDANRQTLVRRLYFDLIGLPPTPAQVDAFLADESPDALETLVDRLIDSPQFGGRWGRHWLDVVRFAESSGMEFNFTYPHAWPYRDYVIASFNADKPFDEFLREQIAGDLLSGDADESPERKQARLIAPSILAFGPKRHNSRGTELQMNVADDQIDVVFKSTMALTVSCARCHDHKFDPIPTTDYYALAGIFLSTEPLYGTIEQKYSNIPTELLPIGRDAEAMHAAAEQHDAALAEAEKQAAAGKQALAEATKAQQSAAKDKAGAEELLAAITARQDAAQDGDQSDAAASELREAQMELDQFVAKADEATARVTALKDELKTLEANAAELKKNRPPRPKYAMTVRDRDKPADTKLAIRGDFRTRGDVVPRGFLSAVTVPDAAPVDPAGSGRLELAHWITSPDNPLTARVMVNRIWHHLFGRGIVPTVDNFGMLGKPPSHPQLLDDLALRFVQEGWSVKRIVRAVVLSRTYQLSSHVVPQNVAVDPDVELFWRQVPRRLDAEAIRDALLAVSGQLDLSRPDGSTVTGLGDQLVRGIPLEKLHPPSNRRSVYLPVFRDYVPELFDLF